MKNSISRAIMGLVLATSALSANASLTTWVTSGPYGSGTTTFDLGTTTPATASGPVASSFSTSFSGASYSGGELFNTVSTGISGLAARPVGSTGNFWSLEGGQSGLVTFAAPISYFGFLWGSPDPIGWNTVSFYHGSTLLGTYDGTLVSSNNLWTSTGYFNVSTGNGPTITSISFSANQNAFETDNHSFTTAVPEPETYAMMMAGLGLIGVVARRRKQKTAV